MHQRAPLEKRTADTGSSLVLVRYWPLVAVVKSLYLPCLSVLSYETRYPKILPAPGEKDIDFRKLAGLGWNPGFFGQVP